MMLLFAVLTINLLLTVHAYDGDVPDETGCPVSFLKRCTCKMGRYEYWRPDEELFIVNCSNSNFDNADMLQQLPKDTQVLIFKGNNVPFLDWNLFGIEHDRTNFEVIDLSDNKIQEIDGKAFHKVSQVKRLVLNHNDLIITGHERHHKRILTNFVSLEELHLTNAFTETIDSNWYLEDLKDILITSNMTKLYKLHLEQNEIWNITDDMFCSLPGLSQLYLADNQLRDITFGLNCLGKLEHVDMRRNKMSRLEAATLRNIDSFFTNSRLKRKLDLSGNPFECDCHLRTFHDWLMRTQVLYGKDELQCFSGTPESNAGKRIINVRRLECSEATSEQPLPMVGHSTTTNTLLWVLIVLVSGLLLVMLYIHRQRVSPIVRNFRRSLQYHSINTDNNSQPPEVNV